MQSPFLQAHGLLKYIGLLLSGVCHQFPQHSFFVAGKQLPLCARCSGTYLGALLGFVTLWRKGRMRAGRLPPAKVLAVLAAFIAFWAIDGLNSYFNFLTGRAILYPPSNLLRLTTGLGNGLALSFVVFPVFNLFLWRELDKQRALNGLGELAVPMLQALGLLLLLQSQVKVLFYPLLLAELLSVLLMLTTVNSIIVVITMHRENYAGGRRQALLPLALGLVLTFVELGGIAALRYCLSLRFY